MKHRFLVGALALACLALTGCGYTQITRDAAKLLPDYEIRQKPKVTCSDFLARIDPEQAMSTAAQRSAVKVCEEMTAGAVVRPSEVQDAMRNSLPGLR